MERYTAMFPAMSLESRDSRRPQQQLCTVRWNTAGDLLLSSFARLGYDDDFAQVWTCPDDS